MKPTIFREPDEELQRLLDEEGFIEKKLGPIPKSWFIIRWNRETIWLMNRGWWTEL